MGWVDGGGEGVYGFGAEQTTRRVGDGKCCSL